MPAKKYADWQNICIDHYWIKICFITLKKNCKLSTSYENIHLGENLKWIKIAIFHQFCGTKLYTNNMI